MRDAGGGDIRSGRRRIRLGAALLCVTVLATACGGGATEENSADSAPDAATDGETAPLAFAAEPAFTLSDDIPAHEVPAVLHGDGAYQADLTGVSRFDVGSGEETLRLEPEHPVLFADDPLPKDAREDDGSLSERRTVEAPLITQIDSAPTLLAAFPVELSAGPGWEIVAADADAGEELWTMTLEPQEWASTPPEEFTQSTLIGVHDGILALRSWAKGLGSTTYGIRLADRAVVWSQDEVVVETSAGGSLVGLAHEPEEAGALTEIVGLSPETGEIRWREPHEDMVMLTSVGPWLAATSPTDPDVWSVYDAEDGTPLRTERAALGYPVCTGTDTAGATACSSRNARSAVAVDHDSGDALWQFPEGGEEWEYGTVVDAYGDRLLVAASDDPADGSVVLDLASGEEIATDPDLLPDRVGGAGALRSEDFTVTFHPAAG